MGPCWVGYMNPSVGEKLCILVHCVKWIDNTESFNFQRIIGLL